MSDATKRLYWYAWGLVALSLACYLYSLLYGTTTTGYMAGIIGGMGIGVMKLKETVEELSKES